MSAAKTPMTPGEFLHRVATSLNTPINSVPGDLDILADLICPALADYTRTRNTLSTDCEAFGIPTTDADGPRSLYQMTGDVVKRWRSVADDSSDLAEVRSRLTAAGYVPAPGKTTGDLVARALRDTREADDRRDEAEHDISDLREQLRAAQEHARDLAEQLNNAAAMVLRMSNTISRVTN
jgi:hypothetical protein